MDWPWIVAAVAFILWFAYFEWRAFAHPEKNNTLSRFIWNVGQNWPLSIFLLGFLTGGLAVHFFWNWCPALQAPGVGG